MKNIFRKLIIWVLGVDPANYAWTLYLDKGEFIHVNGYPPRQIVRPIVDFKRITNDMDFQETKNEFWFLEHTDNTGRVGVYKRVTPNTSV